MLKGLPIKVRIFSFAILISFLPHPVFAQGAAPALYNVKEVVLQYSSFANPKTADACGLLREELAASLIKVLRENNVPAMTATETKPPMMGAARINLVPEISSTDAQGLDCTSWVSLKAQTQNNLIISPVDAPRSVTVIYWQQGALISTGLSTHSRNVNEALQKMAKSFAQQFRIDQPPEFPSGNSP